MILNGCEMDSMGRLGDAPLPPSRTLAPSPTSSTISLPTVTPGVALGAMVVPGMIVGLVDRKAHPFVWWFFGALPLGWAGASLIRSVLK